MKRTRFQRLLSITVVLMVAMTMFFVSAAAAFAASGTVKSTKFKIQKSGKYIYCVGESGIYRLKVKKGVVVKKKKLVKVDTWYSVYGFKKHGKYVYYMQYTAGTDADLYRVKITGGKAQRLARFSEAGDFAIKGKKIYYDGYDKNYNYVRKVMNLNGKGKKNTKIIPKSISKDSNVKGFKIVSKHGSKWYKDYLKTPKKSNYLGKKASR